MSETRGQKPSEIRAGQVFGTLIVEGLSREARNGRTEIVAHCLCRCGHEKAVLARNLTAGMTLSCGCQGGAVERARRRRAGKERFPAFLGNRVGQMIVTDAWWTGSQIESRVGGRTRKQVMLELQCPACHQHVILEVAKAESRKPRSCGCQPGDQRMKTIEFLADRQASYRLTRKELADEKQAIVKVGEWHNGVF